MRELIVPSVICVRSEPQLTFIEHAPCGRPCSQSSLCVKSLHHHTNPTVGSVGTPISEAQAMTYPGSKWYLKFPVKLPLPRLLSGCLGPSL